MFERNLVVRPTPEGDLMLVEKDIRAKIIGYLSGEGGYWKHCCWQDLDKLRLLLDGRMCAFEYFIRNVD